MYLILVPQVTVSDPDLGDYLAPELWGLAHRPHLWGQASSMWDGKGLQALWFRGTPAELDFLVAKGAKYLGLCSSPSNDDRMVEAMTTGDLKSSRDEFVAAYRAPALTAEKSLVTAERGSALLHLVAVLGLVAAAALLGVSAAALSLVVLHQDNFNRVGALNGSTMSDGLGAWTVLSGAPATDGAKCTGDATANAASKDSVMGSIADMRVSCTRVATGDQVGPAARLADASNYYFTQARATNKNSMFKRVAAVNTVLGVDGSTTANGDSLGLDCVGTTITGYLNGAVDVGPVTDAAFASGVAGFRSAGAKSLDDWKIEIPAGAGRRTLYGKSGSRGVQFQR